ncbi:MAG: alanine racemase [Muribaculaceae bacterium]|nr:alanine racemase [Muribaculaceae bacterium]
MKIDISDIAALFNCERELRPCIIEELLTDSRLLREPEKTVFVALRTANNDGHAYIGELADKGVKNFIVDRIEPQWSNYTDINFIKVGNTLEALQKIGELCRKRLKGQVVAITGSIGKTTVKELFNTCARGNGKTVTRSPRSYNSQVGVPLSLWQLDPTADVAIVEAGISRKDEMAKLAGMIHPEIGILTVITGEHDEGFNSRREKIEEKIKLFRECHTIIYNIDDPDQKELLHERYPDKRLIGVHAGKGNDYTDCFAYVRELADVTGTDVAIPESPLRPVTRLEVIDGVNNCRIIANRLSDDPVSLGGALDFACRQSGGNVSVSVIVDNDTATRYGEELACIAERYGIKKCHTTALAHPDNIVKNDFHDEIIVVNTSDSCGVDKVVAILEDKQHETLMEVNLDAMVHNFNFFRSKVKPTTGVVCMLKAHGYGAGSVELARTLQEQGAAYIAVAVVDEGIELRRCGITMPVIVLNPRVYDFHTLYLYGLEPEVYSFELLEKLISHFEQYDENVRFPIHLKVDTGMRRLGFLEEDMPRVAEMLSGSRHIYAKTIFSHLACADDPDEDEYTLSQFAIFERCYNNLSERLPYSIKRHILNSTGIVRFPEHQYDFVRLGIGLYGVPTMYDGSMSELRNVSRLTSTIISIKHWKAGDTVGYNRRGRLTRDSVIATVPIGYADGIDRHLGYGNASFAVNGHRCPTVGSICMDICMIDVTDAVCGVGDRVEIFGDNVTPQMLADTLTTIPYEILTSISPRVKRIYYRE